jgi:hypothetical protein
VVAASFRAEQLETAIHKAIGFARA